MYLNFLAYLGKQNMFLETYLLKEIKSALIVEISSCIYATNAISFEASVLLDDMVALMQ